ncbi:MAG: lysophospholipid acyltransferase family protein, partial [Candidatus Omnitrophota bacterium]
ALPHKNPKVNILFNRQREAHGVTVIPTSVAVRRCMGTLRKGGLLALLGDRDFGSFGIPINFLGRKTLIPKGPVFFACRTGAPIIPCFLTPDGDGHYTMDIGKPIYPPPRMMDGDADYMAMMKACVAVIEEKIKEAPTQWLMFREFGIEF